MNIKDVTEQTGINENTLRRWEKDFKIDIPRDSNGYRKYSDENIKTFKAIKALRDNDNGINTIQKKLNFDLPYYIPENHPEPENNKELFQRLDTVEQNLLTGIDRVMDLSEKYSRATYDIGSLTAEKKALQEKLNLITDGKSREIELVNNELERLKAENEKLKQDFEKEKNKSFWKRLFNK